MTELNFPDTTLNILNNSYTTTITPSAIVANDISCNTISSNLEFTKQVTFDVAPHSISPTLGNDIATKGYVDSLVGQYSGGYNLYLNKSSTVSVGGNSYYTISNVVSNAAQQSNVNTADGSNNLLLSFISDELNITSIPGGIWNLFLYGSVNNASNVGQYQFKLKLYSGGVITDISTSGNSSNVNSLTPVVYTANATISTSVTTALTDRLIIEIYNQSTSGVVLTTYFENTYYSFTQSTLNAGTTLLTSNNNWTGNNTFALPPSTPTVAGTPNNTDIINYEKTLTLLGTPAWNGNATGNLDMSGNNIIKVNQIDGNNAVLAIGTQSTTTNVSIGKSGQTVNVAGSLVLGGNTITGTPSLDGNSGGLSIGRGAGTTSTISIGKSAVAIDLNNTVRFGADGAVSAGTAGQVVTSGGAGAFTRWANPTLPFVIGTAEQPNTSCTSSYQLFTSTAIVGTATSTYLFMFRTNLTSTNSDGTDKEFNITLTTTAGINTPTTSNSFNVLNSGFTILAQRPDELTSLAMTRHYGAIGTAVRQDRTLDFQYLYTFASASTITFGVWSWTNTVFPNSSFVRKNFQLNYIKMS